MSNAPLNIWSRSDEEIGRLMSHFAHTPFELDGVKFASVKAFYTWLLVDETRRPKVAPLWGPRSKHACPKVRPTQFDYHGRTVVFDSPERGKIGKPERVSQSSSRLGQTRYRRRATTNEPLRLLASPWCLTSSSGQGCCL